jgi:hypothetical protein
MGYAITSNEPDEMDRCANPLMYLKDDVNYEAALRTNTIKPGQCQNPGSESQESSSSALERQSRVVGQRVWLAACGCACRRGFA